MKAFKLIELYCVLVKTALLLVAPYHTIGRDALWINNVQCAGSEGRRGEVLKMIGKVAARILQPTSKE